MKIETLKPQKLVKFFYIEKIELCNSTIKENIQETADFDHTDPEQLAQKVKKIYSVMFKRDIGFQFMEQKKLMYDGKMYKAEPENITDKYSVNGYIYDERKKGYVKVDEDK